MLYRVLHEGRRGTRSARRVIRFERDSVLGPKCSSGSCCRGTSPAARCVLEVPAWRFDYFRRRYRSVDTAARPVRGCLAHSTRPRSQCTATRRSLTPARTPNEYSSICALGVFATRGVEQNHVVARKVHFGNSGPLSEQKLSCRPHLSAALDYMAGMCQAPNHKTETRLRAKNPSTSKARGEP